MMAASIVASFLDPLALVIFAGLGACASAAPSLLVVHSLLARAIIFALCLGVAAAASFAIPEIRTSMRFATNASEPYDPNHNPLKLIKGTKYEEYHLMRFVASRNEAETRAIMRRVDETERECRLLTGPVPDHVLWQDCRVHSRIATLAAGILQFAIGVAGVMLWRRPARKPIKSMPAHREVPLPNPQRIKELREKLLEHLEAALAITDAIQDSTTGYLIERALDQARADTWPGNLDLPPR